MGKIKQYMPFSIRILVFLLFIVSGLAKMDPIWAFEKQIVDLNLASWDTAYYLTRLIIASELALGIAILQNHYIKRIVIPTTILLLAIFCVHLSIEMFKHGAMNGNCGCFGQWLPMTPLEAFLKNIVTIGLLLYLYKHVSEKEKGENRFANLLVMYLGSALFMFMFFEKTPQNENTEQPIKHDNIEMPKIIEESEEPTNSNKKDSLSPVSKSTIDSKSINKIEEIKKEIEKQPKKTKSAFANYTFTTGGNKPVNIDEGKQILCMFVPGCDHCREAAKELKKLSKDKNFPNVSILFMDEEPELIPEFFKETQINFPYQVIGVIEFWNKLGNDYNTPGVLYLWNGNVLKLYDGTEANKFDPNGLKKIVDEKYK
ncbi:MAG: protein tlpB [Flavobacteriia bacterium]|nr:protein tlpB [Flavobacteriia bacterium]